MASIEHETLLLLFRNRPELAPLLLRESLGVELPAYVQASVESAALTDVTPAEYRADLVVVLRQRERAVLGIVVEVQLTRDRGKLRTWPNYVTNLRAQLDCPCCLLVITPSSDIAAWARMPIHLGPGGRLEPFVVGPEGVPRVRDPESARKAPELAVLSAMAHGKGDAATAVEVALCAVGAIAQLDEDEQSLYTDVIEAALSEAARKVFEAMLLENYQYRGFSYLKGVEEGRTEGRAKGEAEGKAEGEAAGLASAILAVLKTRHLTLSDAQHAELHACRDLARLRRFVERAVVVQSGAELFDE